MFVFCGKRKARQRRREDAILRKNVWRSPPPSAEEYQRHFYSQEVRDLAFRRYLENAGTKACHFDMLDFIRDDPVLANHLLREATEIIVAKNRPVLTADQKEQRQRLWARSLIDSEVRARLESGKRSKTELREIDAMISRERTRLVQEKLKLKKGFWEKTRVRWHYIWYEIHTDLEDEIFGKSGPLYNPNGWNLQQGAASGELLGAEDVNEDDEDDLTM